MTEPTFNEQIEAYLTEVERLRARIDRLKAENAELKAKYEEMDKFADLMWEEHECENNPCPTCAQYDVLVLGGVR